MAKSSLKIPPAPKAVAATLPSGAHQNQRYTDPTTGGRYQFLGGVWKTVAPPKAPSISSSDASGATIATPPAAPAVPFNWGSAYTSNAQYQSTAPSLAADQNQIGEGSGLVMRRDTNASSPTYGQPIYRLPGEAAGSGSIVASMGPNGEFVWKDAAGNPVDVKGLMVDYVPIKAGESGYLQGALGNAAAQSDVAQKSIANSAAQGGAMHSGMRGEVALGETSNLQGTQAGITQRAMGDYTANLGKWAALYNSIYGGLVSDAASMAPPAAAPEAPAGPAAPDAASGSGFISTVTPDAGGGLSAGPGGEFMKLVGNATLERNTSNKAIREQLNGILSNPNYKLTPQQRAYINSLLAGRYKGNKRY